jgi:hypothetical protein
MNIKKREEKRREEKRKYLLIRGEPRKSKDSLKNVDILAMKKYMKKSHLL